MPTKTNPARLAETAPLMRSAGDIIGSEKLAEHLGMGARNCYHLMSGKREAKASIISETRQILITHRQKTGNLIKAFRDFEDLPSGDDNDEA